MGIFLINYLLFQSFKIRYIYNDKKKKNSNVTIEKINSVSFKKI